MKTRHTFTLIARIAFTLLLLPITSIASGNYRMTLLNILFSLSKKRVVLALLLMTCMSALNYQQCSAQLTTFSFSGIVDESASGGFPDAAAFEAFAGETFTVTYTFNSNTVDSNNGANGYFFYEDAITDVAVTIGDNVYTDISGGDIEVHNGNGISDQYIVRARVTGPAVGGISDEISLGLFFSDATRTAFASGALPLVQPNPDDFDLETRLRLDFFDFFTFGQGNIVACVPECVVTPADQIAVSNIDETVGVGFNVVQFAHAQSFTTGNAYVTLASVSVAAETNSNGSSGLLLRADDDGEPAALIEDLGIVSVPRGGTPPTYTSGGTVLLANTTYWLTLGENNSGSGRYTWQGTRSTDQTSPLGWTIADQVLVSNTGGMSWVDSDSGPPNESGKFSIQVEPVVVADPITFTYSGVADASVGLRDLEAPFVAFNGQTIEVTFTYDPNTPDTNPSANGSYAAISDLEVTVGGNVYTDIDGGNIFITNDDVNPDQFFVSSFVTGPEVGGVGGGFGESIQLRMTFSDSTNTVFSTDALPINQPDPADFDLVRQVDLRFRGPGQGDMGGPTGGNIIASDASIAMDALLGDVNRDGDVNFLDISPFIEILSGGGFLAEADCDESGAVDFLDISPFISILSGG